jgi:preprotein translocase subunit SecE
MANSVASADDNSFGGRMKSLPERIKAFYNDVRTEMRKVTAPSRKEVQSTTTVVLVAIFLFGLYFFIIDNVIGRGVDLLFRTFTK